MALTLHILLAYADIQSSKAYGGCYSSAGMQANAVTRRQGVCDKGSVMWHTLSCTGQG